MTTHRRLFMLMIVLTVSMTTVLTPSFAGASSDSVVGFNHVGLTNPVAITAHGKYLWIINRSLTGLGGDVVRVTASTGAHLAIQSPLFKHPEALVSDGTNVWVVDGTGYGIAHATLARIDIATNKVTAVATLPLVSFLVTIAVAGPYVWIAGVNDSGAVLRVNRTTLATKMITSSLFYPNDVLTADTHYLWVANDVGGPLGRGSLARMSLRTGAVKAVNSPYFNDTVTLTSNGTSVWMPASNHVVTKVDIATGKVIKVSSRYFDTPLWIESTSRSVYVLGLFFDSSSGIQGGVMQINAATNALNPITSKLLIAPMGLAVLGSHVWIIPSRLAPSGTRTKNLLVRVTP